MTPIQHVLIPFPLLQYWNCFQLYMCCHTTFQPRWYASYFLFCVQKILLNLLQSRLCLRVTSVHSCMPLQSWVGLCGLPLELHLIKLVRPVPGTMVKNTIELLSICLMFKSALFMQETFILDCLSLCAFK